MDSRKIPINALINGEPSVLLIIYKTQEEDALVISEAVQKYLSQKERQLPAGTNIKILYDNTDMLRSRIDLLVRNGMIGLMIVFILLWIFLNARLSFLERHGNPDFHCRCFDHFMGRGRYDQHDIAFRIDYGSGYCGR